MDTLESIFTGVANTLRKFRQNTNKIKPKEFNTAIADLVKKVNIKVSVPISYKDNKCVVYCTNGVTYEPTLTETFTTNINYYFSFTAAQSFMYTIRLYEKYSTSTIIYSKQFSISSITSYTISESDIK